MSNFTKLFQRSNTSLVEQNLVSSNYLDKTIASEQVIAGNLKINNGVLLTIQNPFSSSVAGDPYNLNYQPLFLHSTLPDTTSVGYLSFGESFSDAEMTKRNKIHLSLMTRCKFDGTSNNNYAAFELIERYVNNKLCMSVHGGYGGMHTPESQNYFREDTLINYGCANAIYARKNTGVKDFYVGGANASDTDGLYFGRGERPELPFASLSACVSYVLSNYISPMNIIQIRLQSDLIETTTIAITNKCARCSILLNGHTLTLHHPLCATDGWMEIYGTGTIIGDHVTAGNLIWGSSTSKIIISGILTIKAQNNIKTFINSNNVVEFSKTANITFQQDTNNNLVYVYNNDRGNFNFLNTAICNYDNLKLNNCALYATNSSVTYFNLSTHSGNITGKRFLVEKNSVVTTGNRGVELIPGTIAGQVTDNSLYF